MDHKGVKIRRKLVRGTPQGGVLSPVLWNLAMDELLALFDKGPVKAVGYADDLVLISRGKDPTTIRDNLQQALGLVMKWGLKRGLRFSESKSVAVMFTLRHKWSCPKLMMNNKCLEWQSEAKYLGVILDSKLTWAPHIKYKLQKVKKLLFAFKQVVGKEFGPNPQYMRWLYTGIVRPSLCYGSLVWWRAAAKKGTLTQFSRLTRLAMLTWGPIRKGTPTAGLEIIGYLPPLDLYLAGEVVSSWHRIKAIRNEIWDGVGNPNLGHCRALDKTSESYGSNNYIFDEIPETKKLERLYHVDTNSFKDGRLSYGTVKCFTDGSRLKGRAGAGFCIIVNGTLVAEQAIPLGTYPTVFQAEIMAIFAAAEKLVEYAHLGSIVIHSDSQAALMALDNSIVKATTVMATMIRLDELSSKQTVKLSWIKAHVGIPGNEKADQLAKAGSEMISHEPEPIIPVPLRELKQSIRDETDKRWKSRWQSLPYARQSKLFWPSPSKTRTWQLMKLPRQEFGLMVQVLTGHNHWRRHQSLIDNTVSAQCRLCNKAEEDSEHLLCSCPSLLETRFSKVGTHQTDANALGLHTINTVKSLVLKIDSRLDTASLMQL